MAAEAELAPVEKRLRAEPRVPRAIVRSQEALEGGVERDLPRHVADSEVADEVPCVLATMLDMAAPEGHARILRHVEELTRLQVGVAERDTGPDRADVDGRVGGAACRVVFVEQQIACDRAEASVQRGDKGVGQREAS